MSKQSMTRNPNGYNRTPTRKRKAAQLATNGNVTEISFLNGLDSASPQLVVSIEAAIWPPRTKPACPTDQQNAALTPHQLELLIDGTTDAFRKVPSIPHAPPETPNSISYSELIWRNCRTTDTLGKEISDELFTLHVGSAPYHDEYHSKVNRLQHL